MFCDNVLRGNDLISDSLNSLAFARRKAASAVPVISQGPAAGGRRKTLNNVAARFRMSETTVVSIFCFDCAGCIQRRQH